MTSFSSRIIAADVTASVILSSIYPLISWEQQPGQTHGHSKSHCTTVCRARAAKVCRGLLPLPRATHTYIAVMNFLVVCNQIVTLTLTVTTSLLLSLITRTPVSTNTPLHMLGPNTIASQMRVLTTFAGVRCRPKLLER